MKILFVAPFRPNGRFNGGISSFANYIIERKSDFSKQNIELFQFSNCPVKRNRFSNGKITINNFLNFLITKRKLNRAIKKEKPDKIYINSSFGLGLLKDLLTIKKQKNRKVFLHIHFADIDNIITKKKFIRKMILKQLRKKVDDIVLLSKATKDEFIQYGFKKPSLHVLYNYVNPTLKYEKNTKDGKTCLFLGSIDKRKGFYDLIEVFKKIDLEIKLIVCGQPNDKLGEECLAKNSSNKWLDYRGFVTGDEKNQILNQSDLLILPSYGEGLPISIIEAMTCGLAILSTKVGAIPEIINGNGEIIEPGDIDALSVSINNIMSNKSLLSEYQKKSLELSKNFSFNHFKKELIKILLS